jgi:hypothetical protein
MTRRIEEWTCTFCGYLMDAIEELEDENAEANEGDVCVCLKCANPYTLHDNKFVAMTDDELIELPADVKQKLSLIQKSIRAIDDMVAKAKELLTQSQRHMGYTLYENPKDAPNHYVLRGWDVMDGKTIHSTDAIASPINPATLRTIREIMKGMGLTCMGRMHADDPVIVEVWL